MHCSGAADRIDRRGDGVSLDSVLKFMMMMMMIVISFYFVFYYLS